MTPLLASGERCSQPDRAAEKHGLLRPLRPPHAAGGGVGRRAKVRSLMTRLVLNMAPRDKPQRWPENTQIDEATHEFFTV